MSKRVRVDYLVNLHRYDVAEIVQFKDAKAHTFQSNGQGMYFYSADHIERAVSLQEQYIQELESKIKRVQNAHDKLFAQLRKLQAAITRAKL